MEPRGYYVLILILIASGISLYYGRKIAFEQIDEKIRRQAFEEAKQYYLENIEKKFEENCDSMALAVIEKQNKEIERLSAEVKRLKERLKKKNK